MSKNSSVVIYNASAGAGKTHTLVKEYLKIILTSPGEHAHKNILAITFTNKAANEMKSRIVECLAAFATGEISGRALNIMNDLLAETSLGLTPEKIQTKSKKILKTIIHNYGAFHISTIDKFTHKLLRSFSFDLDLSALFEVTTDTQSLLTEAVDLVIAKAGEDNQELTDLLLEFALEKTDDDKSWDITLDIFNMSKLLVSENDRKEISSYKEKTITDFLQIKKQLKELSATTKTEIVNLAQSSLQLIDDAGIERGAFFKGLIPNHFQKLTQGTILKYDKLDYLEEGKRYAKSRTQSEKATIDSIAPTLLENLIAINQQVERYLLFQELLKNMVPLSLLNTVALALEKIQKEKNVLSISEFNAIINKEIQNQPAPFIYERLGEKYRHYFIDEFQDTSEMQWQNLIPLIDNALAGQDENGKAGSLMIVGDPKQSIYRWRGGKAEQLIDLSNGQTPFANHPIHTEFLKTNYRSYSQIIEFNNDFFKFISGIFENPDYRQLYAEQSAQEITAKKGGYVGLEFVKIGASKSAYSEDSEAEEPETQQLYLEAVHRTIQKVLAQGYDYEDITILTRTNVSGSVIANYLTEHQIPIFSSESLLMHLSSEVQALLNALRYLNDPADAMAKAEWLYYLSVFYKGNKATHDFISEGVKTTEKEFEVWLSQWGIQLSFSELKTRSIYEGLEILVRLTILPQNNHAYVQYLLDIALEFDVRKQSGLADFLIFWKDNETKFSIPSPEGNHAVQIMTIHKSKGLEFPIVIMPFVEGNIANSKDQIWITPQHEVMGLSRLLVNKGKKVNDLGEQASEELQAKSQEDLLDALNVLYVAFTRAEEQLHIISNLKVNKDETFSQGNVASFFGAYLTQIGLYSPSRYHYDWGKAERVSERKAKTHQAQIMQSVQNWFQPENIKIAQREALLWDTKQLQAIEYGNLIHEIIAQVTSESEVLGAVQQALQQGLIGQTEQALIHEQLLHIIQHPLLQEYYNPAYTVFNERAILVKNGITIKPDKVVLLPNKQAMVLDYKTGNSESKHQTQINQYAQVLSDMNYSVVRKTIVYIKETIQVVEV